MKNKYIILGCLFTALCSASCSRDEVNSESSRPEGQMNPDSELVSLSVTTNMQDNCSNEGSRAAVNRSLAEGQSISVFLNVFQKDATVPVYTTYQSISYNADGTNGSYDCDFDKINLVRGNDYKVVAWAHIVNKGDSCYVINPTPEGWHDVLTNISQTEGHSQRFASRDDGFEVGESFTAQCDISIDTEGNVTYKDAQAVMKEGLPSLSLRRPVAVVQVKNVRLYDAVEDYEYAIKKNGKECPDSSLTENYIWTGGCGIAWKSPVMSYAKPIYKSYNALTQEVRRDSVRTVSVMTGADSDCVHDLQDYIFCDNTQGVKADAKIKMGDASFSLSGDKDLNLNFAITSPNYLVTLIGKNKPLVSVQYTKDADVENKFLPNSVTKKYSEVTNICLLKISEN